MSLDRTYILIHLNGEWVPCGLLDYRDEGRRSSSVFRYGKKYLTRPDSISIDPVQLPLEDRSFETPEGFWIFNGIRDAGPDKWGRYLLDKKFAGPLNELEYVAASSQDRVGALAFSDSPEPSPKQYELGGNFRSFSSPKRLDLGQCLEAIESAVASEETELLKRYLAYGPSLGGARPKATVAWKNDLYLAKFPMSLDSPDSKDEPLIEYATMTLAEKCGLRVPPVDLRKIGGRSVYLIKRFDREGERPVPFVSGLTMTGTHEGDFGSWSYFSLADGILRFAENPGADLEELFRRLVFNVAVNNSDDHPRNFGFLASFRSGRSGRSGKHWNLSPLYDVVPAVTHTETYSLAMTLGTEGRRASYQNALSLCGRFRLSRRKALRIVDEIRGAASGWRRHFKTVGVSKSDIAMLGKSFTPKN